jgi:hypothetical protein
MFRGKTNDLFINMKKLPQIHTLDVDASSLAPCFSLAY